MSDVIILVMHGAPPKDFPQHEMHEYFTLHGQLGEAHDHPSPGDHGHSHIRQRFAELENKMRLWPRNAENDPFHAGSQALARELQRVTGLEVQLAFNEFCAPSLEVALEQAVSSGADRIIAITPMMTSGGAHSELDIPSILDRARSRHPQVRFIYAWPYEVEDVAQFLSAHLGRFL